MEMGAASDQARRRGVRGFFLRTPSLHPYMCYSSGMTQTTGHPITRLTIKMERAERDVTRLDAWTRDPKNEDSADWDYQYRELRRAECRVRRLKVAIYRIDAALYGETQIHRDTIAGARGLKAWCNRPAWRA